DRRYLALVHQIPNADRGKIDAPVGRSPKHRTRMAVTPDGRPAVTWFEVMERFEDLALLEVRLETGRTHQIRTHLASIGHPIAAAFYVMHARNSSSFAGALGPTPGPNSSGHVSAKRAYLQRAARSDPSTKAAALISLARTMRPADARQLVPSGKLTAIFVKFP